MRTNPIYDSWEFLSGASGPHLGTGNWRFLLVAVFWVAIAASIAIAIRNWNADRAQRTSGHFWTWFFRMMIGVMWFEGSLWKLPIPSGGFLYWLEQIPQHAAFGFHKEFAKNVLVPNYALLNWPVFLAEMGMALSFILGFKVRLFAALGIFFTLNLSFGLYTHPHEWPWLYVFLIFVQGFFIIHAAGRSLGLDALIRRAPFGPFKGDGLIARVYQRVS